MYWHLILSYNSKGMRKMLRQHGFQVYLLDEYCISKTCPACIKGNLTTFKRVQNLRPYRRRETPEVECHCLLSCKNENCMEPMENGSAASLHHVRLWNRDLAGVLSFRHILNGLRKDGFRAARFERLSPKDDDDEQLLLKRLLKRLLKAADMKPEKRQHIGHAHAQP
ncbi:hypothetical protein EV175_007330 [Coemansia sp. RSA 1933]|nr:hypothetical protein EV175_007330 [Coemansia sp. RSA 1933]